MKKGKNTSVANIKRFLSFDWFRKLGRNTRLAMILVAVLVITGGIVFGFTGNSSEETQVAQELPEEIEVADLSTASVTYFEGVVEYSIDEGREWQEVEQDQQLEQGTSMRTVGAISKAVLTFEDQSELRVDANSEVVLQTITSGRVVIKQNSGYTYGRLVRSLERDFVVRTKNAQFNALGTAFRTATTGDEESAEVYDSLVRETVTNKEASQGEKIIISEDNGIVESEVENLDIDDIKDIEFIQWNRQRDMDSELFKDHLGFLSDFDGPEIVITSPEPSSTIKVSDGDNPTVVFEGTTEDGTELTVLSKSVAGSQTQSITVADGKFKSSEVKAAIGNSVFEFVGKDRRGNETRLTISLTVVRAATVQEQGIQLAVTQSSDKVTAEWLAVGIKAEDGVYMVYSDQMGPVYPDSISELGSSNKFTIDKATAGMSPGETYYFRVCRYLKDSNTCDNYSNEVSIVIE